MPFYGCPECGWAATASSADAGQAHRMAVPDCTGNLERIDDWLLPGDKSEKSTKRRDALRQAGTEATPGGA